MENKLLYSFYVHIIFITLFCIWYFFADIYFGYELGDQLIILFILGYAVLSYLMLIVGYFNKSSLKSIFYLLSILFDCFLIFLIKKAY